MRPIQFLFLAFILFALIRVIRKYKQREMQPLEFLFWMLIWLASALIITFPETTGFLADLLGIGRGADLIIYSSLLIAFYLIFRIHLTLNHIEQEITEVVRAIALQRPREVNDSDLGEQK